MARLKVKSFVMLILLFISIIFLSGCIAQRGIIDNYSYLGDAEVTVPNDWTTCKLTVVNSIGKIDVKMAPNTADYLVQATIGVYGRDGEGSVAEANTMTYIEESADTVLVSFTSDWKETVLNTPYNYDIEIYIRPKINLEIIVDNSTGSVNVELTDLTIQIFNVENTTGETIVNLSKVDISAVIASIDVSTGKVDVSLTDISYSIDQNKWNIEASTGQIYVNIEQSTGATQGTRRFDISCSTGEIDIKTNLPDTYGVKVSADTTLGSISIPGSGKIYTTSYFDTASEKYNFNLESTTGSITFN